MSRAPFTIAMATVCIVSPCRAASMSAPPVRDAVSSRDAGYFLYGAALTAETVISSGQLCSSGLPCILGSGGGLALRAGYRFASPWYVGAAYEFSKQDSNGLLRLAILQQLRGELRYALGSSELLSPYLTMGAGAAFYGNEWSASTVGATAFGGIGVEIAVSPTSLLGLAAIYRQVVLDDWNESSVGNHPTGFVSLFGLELELVGRSTSTPGER